MTENILVRLFEHNNWANRQIIEACYALSDEYLDAEPQSATKGSIRHTLWHFVGSQAGYLALLTLPLDKRQYPPLPFSELQVSARISGEGLLSLARGEQKPLNSQIQTKDGYLVQPWVVMVQAINHATEHREQIKSMFSALGLNPPDIDGWDYGLVAKGLVPNTN